MNAIKNKVRLTLLAATLLTTAATAFAASDAAQNAARLETNLAVNATLSGLETPGLGENKVKVAQPTFDVKLFGAVGNGTNLDTKAIQSAIDATASAGGGLVHFAPGIYLSGSLFLKSHVTIWLDKGATLLGSPHRADYSKLDFYALLLAEGQEDIGIAGEGVIDGQGRLLVADTRHFRPQRNPPYADEGERPFIINFRDCQKVAVRDITLKDSACWVQDYHNCRNVTIENIKVRTMAAITNDGLDIDGCSDVVVRGCDIDSEDDGICLKSTDRLCENVLVENCRVRSSCYAFKLGTASVKGFKNITCRNLEIYDTYRSGIALECVDGGVLENVNISHINITNTCNAIFIRLGHRNVKGPVGSLRNVMISDVTAEIPNRQREEMNKFPPDWPPRGNDPLITCSITGLPGSPVRDITLRNVSLVFGGIGAKPQRKQYRLDHLDTVPECAANYPSCAMFGPLPAWGFYCRHADGIKFENMTLQVEGEDFRPALVCDDVKNLTLEDSHVLSAGSEPVIVLKDVDGASVRDNTVAKNRAPMVKTLGTTRNIQSSIRN